VGWTESPGLRSRRSDPVLPQGRAGCGYGRSWLVGQCLHRCRSAHEAELDQGGHHAGRRVEDPSQSVKRRSKASASRPG
jgi:hypothetical protein